MNLSELHDRVNEIAAKMDPASPYFSLRIEVNRSGDATTWTYACYMDPGHKSWAEFSSPEDLLTVLNNAANGIDLVFGKPVDGELPEGHDAPATV